MRARVFLPSRSGWVHTADETAGMLGGWYGSAAGSGAGGGPVTVHLGGIVVNPSPGMDEEALARRAARMIEDTLRDAFSGGHWDGGYRVA